MTSATLAARPAFTFAAAGQNFSLLRNSDDNYTVLDSDLNAFITFSFGGDPEDTFELEDAAVAAVRHKNSLNL